MMRCCWKQQKWALFSENHFRKKRKFVDFGLTKFPGGSELQRKALAQDKAYKLKATGMVLTVALNNPTPVNADRGNYGSTAPMSFDCTDGFVE
eukprot:3532909-Pleurochrysis_carterae.AAC.1